MQEPECGFDTDLSLSRSNTEARSKWETYSSSKQLKIIDQVRASFKTGYGPQPMLYALGDSVLPRIKRALDTCKLYEPAPPESLTAEHWIDQVETFYDRTEKWMIACRELGKTSLANERAFTNNLVRLASRAYECLSAAQGVRRIEHLTQKHRLEEHDRLNAHNRYLCENPQEVENAHWNMPVTAGLDASEMLFELLRLLASSDDKGKSWWCVVNTNLMDQHLYFAGDSLHRFQDNSLLDWSEYAKISFRKRHTDILRLFSPLRSDHVDSHTWNRVIRRLIELGYMGWALRTLEPAMAPDLPRRERSPDLELYRRALRVLRASLKHVDRPGSLDIHELVLLLNAEDIRTSGQGKAWTAANIRQQYKRDAKAGFDWDNEHLMFDAKRKGSKRWGCLYNYPAVRARLLSL